MKIQKKLFEPNKIEYLKKSDIGEFVKDISVKSNNLGLHGWHIAKKESLPALVFFHGNAKNITAHILYIQQLIEYYQIYMIDLRGYGKSDGEANTLIEAQIDVENICKYVQEKHDKYYIYGQSLGGYLGLYCASQKHLHPKGVFIDCAFGSISNLLEKRVGLIGKFIYKFLKIREPLFKNISSKIIVSHSKADDIVPYVCGKYIYNNIEANKEWVETDGPHLQGFIVGKQNGKLQHYLSKFL